MDRLIEFVNPNPHNVPLIGPDRRQIIVQAHQKIILSEWFIERYVPKYLQVVKVVGSNERPVAKLERALLTHAKAVKPTGALPPAPTPGMAQLIPQALPTPIAIPRDRRKQLNKVIENKNFPIPPMAPVLPTPKPGRIIQPKPPAPRQDAHAPVRRRIRKSVTERPIGRTRSVGTDIAFNQAKSDNHWSVSNNIGVGILSYNRLGSLQRLIESIRSTTDLSRVTVFVSDESTDPAVSVWLKQQTDIVTLIAQPKLGVAGNSNRLLRCLSRFKYCYLLNDDVEILQPGWTEHYVNASIATGMHHFCYRQVGLLGATHGEITKTGEYIIDTITSKPHGAVMFYTSDAFRRVGFFDEQFGPYGMEHVDWSNRVGLSGLQPMGFHDILGADRFFKIHNEASAVSDKSVLNEAKNRYSALSADISRVYVAVSAVTIVPAISVIIPVRNTDRDGAIETVVNSMRAQLYPVIELIIVEQDSEVKTVIDKFKPATYYLAQSRTPDQPFTKAAAFNLGVVRATHDDIILHDADMIAPRYYTKRVAEQLAVYEGVHNGKNVFYLSKQASATVIANGTIPDGLDCERLVDYFEGGSLACKRSAYVNIGGFNESYEGYGVEDCDFFERLKYCTRFNNERTVPLIHLWHGRTLGWETHHERNKLIKRDINTQFNVTDKVVDATNTDIAGLKAYSTALAQQFKAKYG